MKNNPLKELSNLGQSIWLDYIRRDLITGGELKRMIDEDGLKGMTSNPAIFEKAISGSHDYDEDIRAMSLEEKQADEMYEDISIRDVQSAADEFRPVYEKTDGVDGYVSLEVSPNLAHDTVETIDEARRLWAALNRPNVFIKVPSTDEGLPAIQQLISEGININVTLLFGLSRYRQVAEACIAGLEARLAQGKPVDHLASVASLFISRIDTLVDPIFDELEKKGKLDAESAKKLKGQVAIANAKAAYQIFKEIFLGGRFKKLAEKGARPQRLLWASTGTKNPNYSDVKYVDSLVAENTINTTPLETFNAYRDHGEPKIRIEDDLQEAQWVLKQLPGLGIDMDKVTQQLEDDGVEKFRKSFSQLIETMGIKSFEVQQEPVDGQRFKIDRFQTVVGRRHQQLKHEDFVIKLWQKDASLWKTGPKAKEQIRNALGWLHVAEQMEDNLGLLHAFVKEVKAAGFKHVVHMGMGGSSLAPIVFMETFKSSVKGLPLSVLDTTDPATIRKIEQEISIEDTLFIVATKSGTTAEPLAFGEYFYAKVKQLKGEKAGENFAAITDPGTPLVVLAQNRGFRKIFLNFSDIGGRYSALSYFGLVPALLMGIDVDELLIRALRMSHACHSCVPMEKNPGVVLGVTMAQLSKNGRDKVTFLLPAPISTFGMWVEQLMAESTGKEGKGILPVASEPIGSPSTYGDDRFFVHYRLKGAVDNELESKVNTLEQAGQPVVAIDMDDLIDLGQEFFRWEIAIAAWGAESGINAFDQPNVQESKDNTDRLLKMVRNQGRLPEEKPLFREGPLQFFTQHGNAIETLSWFLGQAHAHDYIALQAYVQDDQQTTKLLTDVRLLLRDNLTLATTVGFGPRFLHSTGQFHKGGPNNGLFIQLTAEDKEEIPIPGQPYGFSMFKKAQAQGDLEALRKHGRRVLRIHLSELVPGLNALKQSIQNALESHKKILV